MSLFPRAQISKIVDPKTRKTTGYQVAVVSGDASPFAAGNFRTLRGVFRRGVRNMIPPETQKVLSAALGVSGPVTITIGWWIQLIE